MSSGYVGFLPTKKPFLLSRTILPPPWNCWGITCPGVLDRNTKHFHPDFKAHFFLPLTKSLGQLWPRSFLDGILSHLSFNHLIISTMVLFATSSRLLTVFWLTRIVSSLATSELHYSKYSIMWVLSPTPA